MNFKFNIHPCLDYVCLVLVELHLDYVRLVVGFKFIFYKIEIDKYYLKMSKWRRYLTFIFG